MNKPEDYKCIAIWGHMMGSYGYYIKDQQHKAAKENAPLTAIFERDGKWDTVHDITNVQARFHMINQLAKAAR